MLQSEVGLSGVKNVEIDYLSYFPLARRLQFYDVKCILIDAVKVTATEARDSKYPKSTCSALPLFSFPDTQG